MRSVVRVLSRRAPHRPLHRGALLICLTVGLCLLPAARHGSDLLHAEPIAPPPAIELVETFPIETGMDNPDIPEAHAVWLEMIGGATETLDIAEFYLSNEPDSRLEPVVQAVEAAASRGVRVRVLGEEKFYETYPATLDRLAAQAGIEMRRFDVAALMGGVLHAKYFIVDGREAYLGSQNFDWRALTHIQELGVRVRVERIAEALGEVFDTDWALAGGADRRYRAGSDNELSDEFPLRVVVDGDTLAVTPAFSPQGWLPEEALWDLPQIIGLLDGAQSTLYLQLLTYRTVSRDGDYFDLLESALRRAAARGVSVRLQLAHWSTRRGTIEGLQSLQVVPGIEVKLVTIPPWSGGFVPFARVIHSKYLVVDGKRAWIGTSNWEKGYFHDSRNVGLVIDGARIAGRLEQYFLSGWNGPYAAMVDACGEYEAPQIGP